MNGVGGAGLGGGGSGPVPPIGPVSGTQIRLRLLTEAEYAGTVQNLLGGGNTLTLPALPPDVVLSDFRSIGATEVNLSETSIEAYAAAARAITAEVFGTEVRWRALVGCEPAPALDGACTADYIARFGRLAFRRALTDVEKTKWGELAKKLATISGNPVTALAELTATILQSPHFLYRVETGVGDGLSDRYKFSADSVASRVSFLLTGASPSDALLTAAEQGALNTPEGVRQAATALLSSEGSSEHLARFFVEYLGLGGIETLQKSSEFVSFNADVRKALRTETDLFFKEVVLAPGADALAMFDSPRGYINATLTENYGVPATGDAFQAFDFPPESGRAGIASKGGFIAAHSGTDLSSPTRRGVFILKNLLCQVLPDPPAGVVTTLPPAEGPITTRQRLEKHQEMGGACAGCHAAIDPYGFALEHFDAIGRYRATENGLPIDASTTIAGTPVNGAIELGALLRNNPLGRGCLTSRFARHANATGDVDQLLLDSLTNAFEGRAFVWRDFLASFTASEAFLSAPKDSRTRTIEAEAPPAGP